MTPQADFKCDKCSRIEQLPVNFDGVECEHYDCYGVMRRVWAPVTIGAGTSGGTPPRA